MGRDHLSDGPVGSDGRADDNQIRILDGLGGVQIDAVGQPQFLGNLQAFGGAGGDGDMIRQAVAPDDMGQR